MNDYFKVEGSDTLKLFGDWRLLNLPLISLQLKKNPIQINTQKIIVDFTNLNSIDTSGANLLIRQLETLNIDVDFWHINEEAQAILTLVKDSIAKPAELKAHSLGILANIGKRTLDGISWLRSLLEFIGHTAVETVSYVLNPKHIRWKELVVQVEQVGLNAIPVVGLMMCLIGVVIAYLFAIQVEKYGGNLFIADATSLAIFRELSPVIVAIILAGRSGSAFTAQIGTMKLNEEIDALSVMGLSPMRVLVMPRFLALVITLPILVFIGDLFGILGSIFIADLNLGITSSTFLQRMHDVVPLRSFVVGVIKAPVFAAFIAIIGCRMGLHTEPNARSIGLSTTSTVVQSIVAVILLNAGFAVLFVKLGI